MNTCDLIETKPEVMLGKPVIKGTRIPIAHIVRKLAEGASFEDLLDGYPNLSRDSIQAALLYAADRISYKMQLGDKASRILENHVW